MKIAHASIPADDTKQVATVLAEILSGEVIPFPPAGPDSWMVWSGDGAISIEVTPRGNLLTYGEEEGGWQRQDSAQRGSEVHLALCANRPAAETIEIATRAGWPARLCQRGGGVFELVEVWVESVFMIEVLDPAQTARYEAVVTPANLKRLFSEMAS